MRISQDIKIRILSKIVVLPEGCWEWIGSKFNKEYGDGYGQLRMGGRKGKVVMAHRVAYEEYKGEIPKDKEIDHLCHNTLCVNPEHLELVTHAENMKRRKDSGLPNCKWGHKYTPETTYINPKGRRECKTCKHPKFQ